EVRNPEAVYDIVRGELEEDGLTLWNVYLVGRRHNVARSLIVILRLPPPLMPRHLHGQMLFRRDRVERAPREEAVDEEDEQYENGRGDARQDDVRHATLSSSVGTRVSDVLINAVSRTTPAQYRGQEEA